MPEAFPPRELRAAYDRSAATYTERFSALQAVKFDAVLSRLMPAEDARVLDLGCGTGLLLPRLAHLRRPPLACDLSHAMLLQADAGAWRVQGDARRLPLVADCVDVVFAITSLLLSRADQVRTFGEVARVLVRGGAFVLTVLECDVYAGQEEDLAASGFAVGPSFRCGQDVGWIGRRV